MKEFNPPQVAEWQWLDESCGLVYPWYTKPSLEVISKWDVSDKTVLEFGGGKSTLWWERKAKRVVTVETNEEWLKLIDRDIMGRHGESEKLTLIYKPINEGDQEHKWDYINAANHLNLSYDIVVVDGILRTECLQKGIELLSIKGGYIIADNFDQSYVWISPSAIELIKPYDAQYFIQPGHTNHDGKPWQTAIIRIPSGGAIAGNGMGGEIFSK